MVRPAAVSRTITTPMKAVIIKPGREKSLLRRHPWVFSGAIERIEGNPSSGETVEVLLHGGTLIGRGAYSPSSQIAVRIWSFDPSETISPEFFSHRLFRAIAMRGDAASCSDKGAARLVNAESDGLPGVVVDRYANWLVVQLMTAGAEYWRECIARELNRILPSSGIYERSDVDVRSKEGLPLRKCLLRGAEPPELVEIIENGNRFAVDIRNGHKTGFYLDQSDNRRIVSELARGADVLDCFSYTGGFAVAAVSAGARRAICVDSSAEALELSRRNFLANGLESGSVEHVEGDVFAVLRRYRDEGRRFDLVVLDPPKFAESRSLIGRASRGYKDINLLAMKLIETGGVLVTFSCSGLVSPELFQKIVADAALDAGRYAVIVRRLFQAWHHPVALPFPEGSYLKGLVCKVIA